MQNFEVNSGKKIHLRTLRYRFTKQDGLIAIQMVFTNGIKTPLFALNPELHTNGKMSEVHFFTDRLDWLEIKYIKSRIYGLLFKDDNKNVYSAPPIEWKNV